jgi:hypothetical protein
VKTIQNALMWCAVLFGSACLLSNVQGLLTAASGWLDKGQPGKRRVATHAEMRRAQDVWRARKLEP